MNRKRLAVKDVLEKALMQVQGVKGRLDVAPILAVPVEEVEAAIRGIQELKIAQIRARKDAVLATARLQQALRELRAAFNRNVASAEMRFGKYAEELRAVGGRPLGPAYRSVAEPAVVAPPRLE